MRIHMNINTSLMIAANFVFFAVKPLTHAQCPQNCDATSHNTVLGIGALPSVAVLIRLLWVTMH